jgi:hypothetical protein
MWYPVGVVYTVGGSFNDNYGRSKLSPPLTRYDPDSSSRQKEEVRSISSVSDLPVIKRFTRSRILILI